MTRSISFISNPEEIKQQIIQHFKERNIVPIIGSGFTKGCKARAGVVPSGSDSKKYMLDEIESAGTAKKEEVDELAKQNNFQTICEMYHTIVCKDKQRSYLLNNFTQVSITQKEKKDFLSINWPYIYTINSDDGIENNSSYNCIIQNTHEVNSSIFDERKCVIKLHGDVNEQLKYVEDETEVFDAPQYSHSLINSAALPKLQHDYDYNNIVFIGCGLNDEIDLLALNHAQNSANNIYYCYASELSEFQKIRLQHHHITHCIKFLDYDSIYSFFVDAFAESSKIQEDDLEAHTHYSFLTESSGHETNLPYLLKGKDLIQKDKKIVVPYHYIHRNLLKNIIDNLQSKAVLIVYGHGCSGRTYLGIDIIRSIQNKTVFSFQSKENLSYLAFKKLIKKKNSVFVFDHHSISYTQKSELVVSAAQIIQNNSNAIILTSLDDRDLKSSIRVKTTYEQIDPSIFIEFTLSNRFSVKEAETINPLLTKSSIQILKKDHTILDNILSISRNLSIASKYARVTPRLESVRDIACLIMLAVRTKIYSDEAYSFDFITELEAEKKQCKPMIEEECTLLTEKTPKHNSPIKFVVSAGHWLDYILSNFANGHEGLIVEAYKYLVCKCVDLEGSPSLSFGKRNALYKEFILFDTINRIFYSRSNNLHLIRSIYSSLNEYLATDPHYLHQRAKCLIRSSYFESNPEKKYEYLKNAYHDAITALSVFEERLNESKNEYVAYSLAHTKYTSSLCLCHICRLHSYQIIEENDKAIIALKESLTSPQIQYSDVKKDSRFNYGNVIEEIIIKAMTMSGAFSISSKDLTDLFYIVKSDQS